jgi:hypothetical protein
VVVTIDLLATRFVKVDPLPEHQQALEAEAAETNR